MAHCRAFCYIMLYDMARMKLYSFAIEPDLAVGLKRVKARDGIPESEQIRRALRRWLEQKGRIGTNRKGARKDSPK